MTANIIGLNEVIRDWRQERTSHPPWDRVDVLVTLEELWPDCDGADISFTFTNEGLIVDFTDLNNEVVGTWAMTYEEIVTELLGVD